MTKFIHREQLYQEVWKTPLTKLAPSYKLSTYAMKKLCDTFCIPMPKAGYWSKIAFGKTVDRPPIPDYAHNRLQVKKLGYGVGSTLVNKVEKTLAPTITVKKNLTKPHSITIKTRDGLKKSIRDEYGMKRPRGGGFDLRVSKKNERRALLIIDTLCKWFEKNDCKIHQPFSESITTEVIVGDEAIRIKIEEKSKLTGKTARKTWGNYTFYDREYTPTEKLSLVIDNYCWGCSIRKVWNDGKASKIEEKLGEFAAAVFEHAKYNHEKKLREEAEALERERQRKLRKYQEACEALEKQMLEDLITQSDNANKSRELIAYIGEVKSLAQKQYVGEEYPIELKDWIIWAENYAKELNPLAKGVLPRYRKATEILRL